MCLHETLRYSCSHAEPVRYPCYENILGQRCATATRYTTRQLADQCDACRLVAQAQLDNVSSSAAQRGQGDSPRSSSGQQRRPEPASGYAAEYARRFVRSPAPSPEPRPPRRGRS